MKILFFGYSEIGAVGLEFLLGQGEGVAAVVTHRDDPHEARWFRSVAEIARKACVPVHVAEETDLEALAASVKPDLILSFYYRKMLPMRVLAHARLGGVNLHGSLLPKYRGRAPVNWVLVRGERETGVTLHHMVARADAGDIVAQRRIDVAPRETALTLSQKCAAETRRLLEETWPLIRAGRAPRIPQDDRLATTMPGRRPEDGRIDWTQPAERIDGLVRAVTRPWPGAFTTFGGCRLMVWAGEPAEGGSGRPGEVLAGGLVAAGGGAFRVTDSDPLPAAGSVLGT
jgi:methionyl-tRNA formyltransferase